MKKTDKPKKSLRENKNTLAKLLAQVAKYRLLLAASIVLAALSVVLQLYVPILFGSAIDGIIAEGAVDFDMVGRTLLRIVIAAAVSALAAYIMNLVNNHMTYRVVEDLRLAAIKRLQRLPLSYLDSHSTGDIVSRVIADTSTLSDGLLLGFTQLFSGVVTIGVTLVFMFSKNVWASLLVMLLTPLSFFVAKFVSSRSFRMFRKQSEVRGRQTALIEEMIGGQKIVHSFGYEDISSVITEMQNALACASRIFELLETPEEVPEEPGVLEAVRGEVDIRDVCFSYDKNAKLIEDFNLHVEPGMRVAIVGPTGCGKTTFINLLMRFYDVDSGEILLDGKPIRSLTRHALRKNFGMVLQDTWIKRGTVRENICFGKPDATEEDMIRAAKEAHSYEFIRRLPKGFDTVLNEDSISQGQKQLLCITRVMLALPFPDSPDSKRPGSRLLRLSGLVFGTLIKSDSRLFRAPRKARRTS